MESIGGGDNPRQHEHFIPRIALPDVEYSWLHKGYLFGNRNGRSIYNMVVEGTCGFAFLLVLWRALWSLDLSFPTQESIKLQTTACKTLILIALAKNLLLTLDLVFLLKARKYSPYNILILLSNCMV